MRDDPRHLLAVVGVILATCAVSLLPQAFANAQTPLPAEEVVEQPIRVLDARTEGNTLMVQVQQLPPPPPPRPDDDWIDKGEGVGIAINAGLESLSEHSQILAQTDLGAHTIFLISWRVIGSEMVHIGPGLLWFLVGLGFILWSAWNHCRLRRVCTEQYETGAPKEFEVVQPSGEVLWAHAGVLALHIVITTFIIFSY